MQSKNANVWDYFFVASSYKNLKKFDESFKIAQEGIENFKDNCKILKNLLAQLIYDLYLKNEEYYLNDNIIDTWQLFNSLLSDDYAYLSKQKAFFTFVKNLSNKNVLLLKNFFANFELTEKDFEDENITDNKITFPSVALTYVYFYSKILFSQKKFNECIDLIQKITPKIKSYKFDYEIWLKRILAKSYMYIEKFANTVELYNQILKKKESLVYLL